MRARVSVSRFVGVVAAVAAAVAVCAVPAGATGGSGGTPAGTAVRYARDVPLCPQPKNPHTYRCFAVARVPAAPTAKGAYRYTTRADVARGPAGGYTPGDLAKAYGFDPHVTRSNLTVGVVLWYDDPTALSDLNTFDKHYGFKRETARSFRKVNGKGAKQPLPQPDADSAAEISLDLQAIRATCRTCRLLLVEASAPTSTALATAENTAIRLGAQVVNNSYGAIESRVSPRVRNAYDHPGRVIVAATGDDGWYGWDKANSGTKPDGRAQFPSVSPNVVAVGGTTLQLGATGKRVSETVWDGNGPADKNGGSVPEPGASGGGCSRLYAAKPWQRHQHGYFAASCKGKRLAADVSADADPDTGLDVYDSFEPGGWVTIGGTSLAAPLISGMFALAGGSRGVRYPSSELYVNADVYGKRRFDVHRGGNGFCGGIATKTCATDVNKNWDSSTHNPNNLGAGPVDCSFPRHGRDATHPPLSDECNAVRGYDGTSGVGTPTSLRLFHRTAPSVRIIRPARKRVGRAGLYVARVREHVPDTHATTYTWKWGGGRSTTTHHARVRHTYHRLGRHRITLTVTDSRYQSVVVHTSTVSTR